VFGEVRTCVCVCVCVCSSRLECFEFTKYISLLRSNPIVLYVHIYYALHLSLSTNENTVMSAITTLMYLITPETRLGKKNSVRVCVHACVCTCNYSTAQAQRHTFVRVSIYLRYNNG